MGFLESLFSGAKAFIRGVVVPVLHVAKQVAVETVRLVLDEMDRSEFGRATTRSGKTPVVTYLVERLTAQGKRVAILSRGYRRRSRAPQLLVSDGQRILAGPDEAGDEPYLIARRCPQAVVAVGADRYALGQWVLEQLRVDCFVLDDGFQHVQLHRDLNLLLVDATDSAGLRAALPVGRLREPLSAAARASAILITRVDEDQEGESVRRVLLDACGSLPSLVRVGFRAEECYRVPRPWAARRGTSAPP